MLADLDETIRRFLIGYAPLDTSEVDISFDTPDREWSSRLNRPTVNCFLLDLKENHELRSTGYNVARENGSYVRTKEPIRLDATYQVSVWAQAAEDEHQLLWHVLATLSRHPSLPEDTYEGEVRAQPFGIIARVAQPDDGPRNVVEMWQAIDNKVRPTITYTLTVALDPNVATSGPLVLRRRTRVEQLAPPVKLPDAVNPEIVDPTFLGRRLVPPAPATSPIAPTIPVPATPAATKARSRATTKATKSTTSKRAPAAKTAQAVKQAPRRTRSRPVN